MRACFLLCKGMKRNVGPLEWKLRVAAGIVVLSAAFFIEWPDAWEGVGWVLGAALLITGLVRYCPVNQLLGRKRVSHAQSTESGNPRRS